MERVLKIAYNRQKDDWQKVQFEYLFISYLCYR